MQNRLRIKGMKSLNKGKFELAISFYKIALKHHESSILYSNIARCYLVAAESMPEDLAKNHLDKCIENWAQSLSQDPENIKAVIIMGDCSIKLAHHQHNSLFLEEAIEYYNKAIRICQNKKTPVNIVEISNFPFTFRQIR